MKGIKISFILTMLVVVLAAMAVSGCTSGSVVVPSAAPTTAPTAVPTVTPTDVPVTMPTSTPAATPAPSPAATDGHYPTMSPWMPGTATFTPTPNADGSYTLAPWVDQKIQVPVSPDAIILVIKGKVDHPMNYSINSLRALGVKHVNLTLVAHGNTSYIDADAVSLNAVLDNAGLKSDATAVKFWGSDGFTPKTPVQISTIRADSGSVIAFTSADGLRDCLPTQPAGVWVKNLVTIEVI